jgi:hypothetical protein
MKNILSVILLAIWSLSCGFRKANPEVLSQREYDIPVTSSVVKVDNLNRLYLADDKNRVINFAPDNRELYRYANNRSGYLSTIDVSNPLRIVLFYDDFNHVKIMDNTLTVISEMALSETFSDITACSSSNDGHLWIYDPVQFRLLKIRDNGSIITESSNVHDFGMTDVQISDIIEKNNTVVLCDRQRGFYFFDNLGQYKFHYPAPGIRSLFFDGRHVIYYTESEGLQTLDTASRNRTPLSHPLKISPGEDLQYILFHEGDYFYVFRHGIDIFRKVGREH